MAWPSSSAVEELARCLAHRAQERLLIVYTIPTIPYLRLLPSCAILYHRTYHRAPRTGALTPSYCLTISRSWHLHHPTTLLAISTTPNCNLAQELSLDNEIDSPFAILAKVTPSPNPTLTPNPNPDPNPDPDH